MNWPQGAPDQSGSPLSSASTSATAAFSGCGPRPGLYMVPVLVVQTGARASTRANAPANARTSCSRERSLTTTDALTGGSYLVDADRVVAVPRGAEPTQDRECGPVDCRPVAPM